MTSVNNTQQWRYRMISITTFIVLLISFAYYYFVFVKSNETFLNEKAFRILERSARNLADNYTNYVKVSLSKKKDTSLIEGIEVSAVNAFSSRFFKYHIVFVKGEVLYHSPDFSVEHNISLDSLFQQHKGVPVNIFHSAGRLEIMLRDEPYLLFFTPVIIDGKTIFVGGVIEKSFYRKQAYKLGTNTSIVILVLLILLIFSLPFAKLFLLSENERVSTMDAVISFFTMALISGFLTMGMLAYFTQQGPEATETNNILKEYSKVISSNFKKELTDILKQLKQNDSLLNSSKLTGTKSVLFPYDKRGFKGSVYKFATGTFWMNGKGDQLVKWQPGDNTPRVSVSKRDYFLKPLRNRLWKDSVAGVWRSFYIEPIHTWTTGKYYAMVSMRSNAGFLSEINTIDNKPVVVSIGSEFKSLTNLSLPSNITYMVIDERGRVLFHKDKTKVLQENLFEETNNNKKLLEAIYGRNDTIFKSNYDHRVMRFSIHPFEDVPWFLLVGNNEEQSKMSDAQVLGLTMQLYVLLLILVLVQIIIFSAVDYSPMRKVKVYSMFFKWIWPEPGKIRVYQLLSVYLLLSMLIYVAGSFSDNILLSLAFFSFVVTVNLFSLHRLNWPDSSFFKWNVLKYVLYFAASVLLGIILFALSDDLFESGTSVWFYIFFFVSVAMMVVSMFVKEIANDNEEKAVRSLRFTYNSWALLFLFVLSALPVLGFYVRSYNFEKTILIQHRELSLAKEIEKNNLSGNSCDYNDNRQLNGWLTQNSNNVSVTTKGNESSLIKMLRIPFGKKMEQSAVHQFPDKSSKKFYEFEEGDTLQLVCKKIDGAVRDITPWRLTTKVKKLLLSDFVLMAKPEFSSFRLRLGMVIAFLVFILAFYFSVTFWSSRLFLLGLVPYFESEITALLKSSKFIYIVSPPYAGIKGFLAKTFNQAIYYDDIRFGGSVEIQKSNKAKIVVLFDAVSIDKDTLAVSVSRIDNLKQLVNEGKLEKLIVISAFSPAKILNTVEENKELLGSSGDSLSWHTLKKVSDQYLALLGGFTSAYFKLGTDKEASEIDKKFLARELDEISILNPHMFSHTQVDMLCDEEDILLNVQNKAQLHYYAIWNSLSKRERFILYDLAQDGLVNYRNLNVIFILLNRGILKYKHGRMQLFNVSFANFVLTIIGKKQSLMYEHDAIKTGSWSNLKMPLFIIIAAAIAFLFLTQQQVFSELTGWLTAAVAVLPVITKLLVTFGGTKK